MTTRSIHLVLALLLAAASVQAQTTMTLDRCRTLALENNAASRNSALERSVAHQVRQEALTKYFPSISAGGLLFRAADPLMEMATKGGNLPVYDGHPINIPKATQFAYMPASTMGLLSDGAFGFITAVQPVFAGGRIITGNTPASLGEDAQDLQQSIVRNRILIATDRQYWQLVSLLEKRTTVGRFITLLDGVVRQVQDAVTSGLTTRNDLLKVRVKRSEMELTRSKLENGITLARMAFCQHLGIPFDSTLVPADTLSALDGPETHQVDIPDALTRRPEHALLELSVRAEELKTRMAWGENLPQLAVGVSGVLMKMDESDARTVGMAFATVQVPISSWWGGTHAIEASNLREEIARSGARENNELMQLQMEKTWRDLVDAHTRVRLAEEARGQAEEALRESTDGHTHGLVTLNDVLEAQASLQKACDELTEARAAYRTTVTEFHTMTGR